MTLDVSKKGWGASWQGITTGGPWSKEEQNSHINILELKTDKEALLSFTKCKNVQRVHIKMDNVVAPTYLLKMGVTHHKELLELSKEIWKFPKIQTNHDYCRVSASHLNVISDWESTNFQDKSKWKLLPTVFRGIYQKLGTPDRNLLALRTFHQIPPYFAWRQGPTSKATNALQHR